MIKRSEKGSITLFTLIAMMFFLTIAFTAYVSAMTKLQAQNENLERIKTSYEQDITPEGLSSLYDSIVNKSKLDENGCYKTSGTINGSKGSSTNPTIPAGFKPADTSTSNWGDGTNAPSIASVNAGLVIEDKDGNQFVWVPVDGTSLKYEKHIYATPVVDDTKSTNMEDTGNGNWKTYYYRNWNGWTDDSINLTSVEKYGGFYIARYEAGVPENATFFANTNGASYSTSKNVTEYRPVSKANNQVWNYIDQINAKIVAEKMYNTSTLKSKLIDSYAWDTVMQWLYNSGYNITDSTLWGNYQNSAFSINGLYALHTYNKGWNIANTYSTGTHAIVNGERTEIATGITDRNKSNNIYDLAGNVWEWTTEIGKRNETDSINTGILRGGEFGMDGINYPACARLGNRPVRNPDLVIGFRVVLYLE